MEFLLSIHKNGFYSNYDFKWVEKILEYDKNNNVSGCEIYINFEDENDIEYVSKLITHPLIKHWKFQFHGPELFDGVGGYTYYSGLLKYYHNLSKKLGYTARVNFHPIEPLEFFSAEYAENHTIKELNKIFEIIDKHTYNIEICIENLNLMHGHRRCNLMELSPILQLPKVNFTWDIGHEIKDNVCTYFLDNLHEKKLKNMHIHDVSPNSDHSPFYYNGINLSKTFDFLNSINYNGSIVAEIGLSLLKSTSFEDRLKEYVENINILKNEYICSKIKSI